MSKELNITETSVQQMNVNIIGNEQQYVEHSQDINPTDVTLLIENPSQYVQPARNEITINKFPDQNAFNSQASNLTWSDLSAIYEDNDFVDKSNMFVYFYDYDGSIAYKYNIDEFFVLEELPPLPNHSDINKICDGWNWTLQEIKDYLEEYPADINVGCTVHCGSNPELGSSHVIFHNYDGEFLYDYTAAQFLALTELPALPDLSSINRVADGWNWTLAEITQYLYDVDGDVHVGFTMSPGSNPSAGSSMIRFYDYEGTLLYEYTAAQFLALSALPTLPDRTSENLTCDGWNWTLSEITSYLNTVDGDVNVGANYHTTDNKTHITCKPTETFPQAYICLTPTAANAVTVDWGDGTTDTWTSASQETKSHTYTGVTDSSVYDIAISCSSGTYKFNNYITNSQSYSQSCVYTDVKLSNKVTSFWYSCFYNCYSLQSITIPSSVTSLGTQCFYSCSSLRFITIPSAVTNLGTNCFYCCYSLQSIAIPSGVTSLDKYCFYGCSSLQSITIPSGVTSLDNYCFYGCSSLQSITIPNTVTNLGDQCFYNCFSLQHITIPSAVTNLGTNCFSGCYSLRFITIPSGVTSFGNNSCFQNCSSLQSITIPSGVTNLGTKCFYGCSSLRFITIPNTITSLGTQHFNNCYSLQSITIPNTITTFGNSCFYGCSSLQSITIPSGVTTLESSCFYGCSSLQFITIPSSITDLASQCFSSCFSLQKIYMQSTTPPTLANKNAIPNNAKLVIYVPTGTLTTYQTATNWSSFSSKMVEYNNLVKNTSITSLETNKKIIFDNITSYNLLDKNITVLNDAENYINDVNFYDYDGKLLYSYTKNDFLNLTNLPSWSNGTNENLTFEGWNWTLANIKTQINTVDGVVNVGAIYHTTDNKTHITCKPTETFPQAYICLTPTIADAVTVDWGDGTTDTWTSVAQAIKNHTYTGVTNSSAYDIAISCSSGTYSFSTYITGSQSNNQNCVYTDVKLSNQVTRLSNYCFYGCSSLQSIAIPDNVTSLGDYCFSGCSSLQSIIIPNTVTSLGTQCFYNCYFLQSIAISSSVTSLGINCFSGCYSLQFITISNTVTTLGNQCFSACYSLQSITIPDSVRSLNNNCFQNCYSLQFITIPNSVRSLGDNCFQNCYSLQSITIPNSVTSLSNYCFSGCYSLQHITIPSGVTTFGNSCFYGCSSLQSITIPNAVTSLGNQCFFGCYSLQSITIPSGVTSLEDSCFRVCYSLQSITIPNTVTSLGNYCFYNCYSLQSITMPNTVTGLGNYCFYGCHSLQYITIPNTVTSLGSSCFYGCYSLQSITIPSGVTSLGTNCFQNCCSLQSIAIPDSVTSLSNYCFYCCYSLQSITIPSSVTSLGTQCFYGCSSLQSITIPSAVTSLENQCFYNCFSLQSVIIPSGVTSFGNSCFQNCYSLQHITIPRAVTSLNAQCFYSCSSLQKIYMEPTTPPTLSNTNAIQNNTNLVIYVPTGSLSAYQTASNWSTFASKMKEL